MKRDKIKQRDKTRTHQKMLDAVGHIIATAGTSKVTVQVVADLAGVNKVLVYRYFGSVENLIEQYFAAVSELVPSPGELLAQLPTMSPESEAQQLASALKYVLAQVWENRSWQAMIKREIATGKLTSTVLLDYLALTIRNSSTDNDFQPLRTSLVALIYSAICYLGLAMTRGDIVGLDLRSKGARKKIEALIDDIVRAVLRPKI